MNSIPVFFNEKNDVSGIYLIRNTINGKFYIGSSQHVCYRWRKHKETLIKNNHQNIHLQRAWNNYDGQNFIFELLCTCELKHLHVLEQHLLDRFFGTDQCYNLSDCATHPRGYKHTDAAKKKIGDSWRGKKHTLETKQLISNKRKDMKFSESHRKNMGLVRKGKSINVKEKNPMFGKTWNENQRIARNKLRGTNHGNSKLTESDVIWIRNNYGTANSYNSLARKFQVNKKTIIQVVKRRIWTHI
jgi:group I intron endonuclease